MSFVVVKINTCNKSVFCRVNPHIECLHNLYIIDNLGSTVGVIME